VFLISKMSSLLNIGEICDMLIEEIPSDDSDNDKDYFPPSGESKTIPILESSDDESDDENI
jgi:hypothetical protein